VDRVEMAETSRVNVSVLEDVSLVGKKSLYWLSDLLKRLLALVLLIPFVRAT